jgi:ABC-2 type transport system ATP-binding protein
MLSIKNLTHTYANGVKALDDVSIDIGPGMFGLLGPNGAGKSTLMRTLATLQTATSGTISFNGDDIARNPNVVRKVLGYLPQDFGVYPRTSARDMLDHMAVLKGITNGGQRRGMVDHLLNQVNLWDKRNKAVAGFSGGMRQRFGIAQALIGNPRLVIVDEPTAGLDPEERHRFLNLLASIGKDVIIILSTHIVEDVANLCPRLAIMADGKIVAKGAPSAMLDALRGRLWRGPLAEGAEAPDGLISTTMFAGESYALVLDDSCPTEGFEPMQPTLEHVYFATLAMTRTGKAGTASTQS